MEVMTFNPAVNASENQLLKIDELEAKLKELPGGSERNDVNFELLKYQKQYKLRVLENDLREAVQAIGENFLKIGASLVEIDNHYLYTVKWEYGNIADYAEGVLGLKRSTAFNLMKVCREYCGGSSILNSRWEGYSYSQLVEMLPLSDAERRKITPEMTVKAIREYRQHLTEEKEKQESFSKIQTSGQNCEKTEAKNNILPGRTDCLSEGDSEVSEGAIGRAQASRETVIIAPTAEVIEPAPREIRTDCWDPETGLELKNDKAREEWLNNYADWGLWIEVPELKLRYYRYRFPEQKVWFVVTEYWRIGFADLTVPEYRPLHALMKPEDKGQWAYFYPKEDSLATCREWLKEHREELKAKGAAK